LCIALAVQAGIRKFTGTAAIERPAAFLPRAAPPTGAPLLEYRRHYDVEAPAIDARTFRPGWRRRTRVAALFEDGQISREAFVAGMLWRQWVETLGQVAVQRWTARIGAQLRDGPTPAQIVAARELRSAGAALGPYRTRILFEHLVEDLSGASSGSNYGSTRRPRSTGP
jgi:hypothetical protein